MKIFKYQSKLISTSKIFIFGSNGMLGNYMKSFLGQNHKIVPLSRKDFDLNNLTVSSLTDFLKSKNLEENDIVINCAGIIPQSLKNTTETRSYFLINSLFPVILSLICQQYKAKMIHITTDCVFSGKKGKYSENSIPDEINDYGVSKSLGEIGNATIIRTSIIGEELYNKKSLLEWVRSNEGGKIKGYNNHYWNGITCLQLCKIVNEMIQKNIYWQGVRHIFSPNSLTKYELIDIINQVYKLNIEIEKYSTENKIDKTIQTIYEPFFTIPDLKTQIVETRNFF